MTYTITMTEAEIKNIMNIAEAIDSSAVEFINEMLKDNIIVDFGGIIIRVQNHNSYEVELTPNFSEFLLTGPIMDIASMSKVFKNIFGKLFNGINEHFRAPITTYLDDDGNTIKIDDMNIDEDMEPSQYDIEEDEDEENSSISETVSANEEPAAPENISPSEKTRREFAIFNV